MRWKAPPIWQGGECWILGGGPSVFRQFGIPDDVIKGVTSREIPPSSYSDYLSPIHDKHVIGINNAYQIGTWIDVLYFGDCTWYNLHRLKLIDWPGLKVSHCARFQENVKRAKQEKIKFMARDKSHKLGISRRPGHVSWNFNSGAAAISLAAHFGVKRIILLGFDMAIDKKTSASHWHGSHRAPGEKPKIAPEKAYRKHLTSFPQIAKEAKERGLEIINASPKSAIQAFQKVRVKDLLTC